MGKITEGDEKEHEQDWLTTKQVAKRLNRPEVTLVFWRMAGRGPKFITDEHRYLYKLEEVEKWEKEEEEKKDWLTTKQVAKRLKRPEVTLTSWRRKGLGPKFITTGYRILYKPGEVEKWEKEEEEKKDWLTTKQVAKRLKRPAVTIANWRLRKTGPEFIRKGHRYLYKLEDVKKWKKQNPHEHDRDWLTTKQVAKRLNRPEVTLEYWRMAGRGPEFIRKGHRILYNLEGVEKWEKENPQETRENEQDWLTTKELAKRWNRPAVTLGYWREKGVGPEYIRNSGRIFYRLEEVEKWEKENPQETKKNMSRTGSPQRSSQID